MEFILMLTGFAGTMAFGNMLDTYLKLREWKNVCISALFAGASLCICLAAVSQILYDIGLN